MPHHSEIELLVPCKDYQTAFLLKCDLFDHSLSFSHFSFENAVESTVRRIRMIDEEIHAQTRDQIPQEVFHAQQTPLHVPSYFPSFTTQEQNKCIANNIDDSYNDLFISHDLPSCSMSMDDLCNAIPMLTSCQKNALFIIADKAEEGKPYYVFISGSGGVGKSYLTRIIIALLQHKYPVLAGSSPVLVCAPTGTAARNIRGSTIHSLSKIPVDTYLNYEPLHGNILNELRITFLPVSTIIIDEISMVSSSMLTYISRRLSEITLNDNVFGGMSIIAVGDLFQLRPIYGRFVFHNRLLWQLFRPVFLDENIRQANDQFYSRLLNRARLGILLQSDIVALKKRIIDIKSNDVLRALHVYPTRSAVTTYNAFRQSHLAEEQCAIKADHYFSSDDVNPSDVVPSEYIPNDDRDAGNLPSTLICSVNTRIMLIRNIMTDTGLVNGAMGVITSITYRDNHVDAIHVRFDDATVGGVLIIPGQHDSIPINKVVHEYRFRGRRIIRQAFPLVPCWACTVHKVQGMSLNQIVLDIGSSVFADGMTYVGLSRVTHLDGLYLTCLNLKKIKAPDDVLDENKRLRDLLQ
jgi:hypothetical protein